MKTSSIISVITLLVSFFAYAKRVEPELVEPLISGEYVYTVPHWAYENGTNQNGGYIRVLDAKTGVPVWGIQVYKTNYDPNQERDVQDVFISSIEINIRGTVLTVTDELGNRYRISIGKRKVLKVE